MVLQTYFFFYICCNKFTAVLMLQKCPCIPACKYHWCSKICHSFVLICPRSSLSLCLQSDMHVFSALHASAADVKTRHICMAAACQSTILSARQPIGQVQTDMEKQHGFQVPGGCLWNLSGKTVSGCCSGIYHDNFQHFFITKKLDERCNSERKFKKKDKNSFVILVSVNLHERTCKTQSLIQHR